MILILPWIQTLHQTRGDLILPGSDEWCKPEKCGLNFNVYVDVAYGGISETRSPNS